MLSWRRVRFTLIASSAVALLLSPGWKLWPTTLLPRAIVTGLVALLAFGWFERWPRRLPAWLARWVLQVLAVAAAIPIATFTIYVASTTPGAPPFWDVPDRFEGFFYLTFLGVLIAPWAALAALVRQKDALARHQALEFDLERSELERQALEARLRLLQAQVAPHFLFNSLANVQALVDAGSPKAATVLRSLTAYLRAAVPRLHDQATTLGEELDLVRAYLELMHLRMPDRLQFAVHVDDDARALRCPPITLLTLVENAVRHGIDPSEEGGRIDVEVRRLEDRCLVRVRDTGVGLRPGGDGGLGTGLSTLRERLALIFGEDAELRVTEQAPHGVCAEIDLPAQGAAT
jgi:signal transduction histidine kinase